MKKAPIRARKKPAPKKAAPRKKGAPEADHAALARRKDVGLELRFPPRKAHMPAGARAFSDARRCLYRVAIANPEPA